MEALKAGDLAKLQKAANTIRFLAADMVEAANSGHPGAPMGLSDVAVALSHFIRLNPANPRWLNRDRLVFSGGHASALVYSLLHLCGFDIALSDLQAFRKMGSKTPGHPEFGHTPGVEITTGPLGQGVANAVGFAMATMRGRAILREIGLKNGADSGESCANFGADSNSKNAIDSSAAVESNSKNTADSNSKNQTDSRAADFASLLDHKVYCLCGDGDLQEGIAYEAASLAGRHGLSNLILIYDSNGISIEGDISRAFDEDVAARFRAQKWEVLNCDGHDFGALFNALESAQSATKPTLIIAKTTIGKGAQGVEGSEKTHGAPLGAETIAKSKAALGFDAAKNFQIDSDVELFFSALVKERGALFEKQWQARVDSLGAREVLESLSNPRIDSIKMPVFERAKSVATRVSNGAILNAVAEALPNFIGGSADLAPSNNTALKASAAFPSGQNIAFGIREHAMAAITNAFANYGIFLPFCATFFVFSDYLAGALRVAALSKTRAFFIFTHDSIGVGEDGATHEPVEHLGHLRALPNLVEFRPCDAFENAACWRVALTLNADSSGVMRLNDLDCPRAPVAFVLSRQNLREVTGGMERAALENGVKNGAYILKEVDVPAVTLVASGSEVALALDAAEILGARGVAARVVSAPSFSLLEKAGTDYATSIFAGKVIAIEAARALEWHKFADLVISMNTFGASAPGSELFAKFGFTKEAVAQKVLEIL